MQPCVLFLEKSVDKIPVELQGFEVNFLVDFVDDVLLISNSKGAVWRLMQPEPLYLGLIFTEVRTSLVDNLETWWRSRCGESLSTLGLFGYDDIRKRGTIQSWLNQRLLYFASVVSMQNAALFRQNRALRNAYDTLQSSFSRLETQIVRNQLLTPVQQNKTDQIFSFWRPAVDGAELKQTLPVLSGQLSYLELFFQCPDKPSDGELRIKVQLEPAAIVGAEWNIAYRDISAGWNVFTCPRALADNNEVLLECVWTVAEGSPAVALSSPHWHSAYGALAASPEGQTQSLVTRLWSTLPGVRPRAIWPRKVQTPLDREPTALAPRLLAEARLHVCGPHKCTGQVRSSI